MTYPLAMYTTPRLRTLRARARGRLERHLANAEAARLELDRLSAEIRRRERADVLVRGVR